MIISQGYPLWVVHRLGDNSVAIDFVVGWQFLQDIAHEGNPGLPIGAARGLLDPANVIDYATDPATADSIWRSSR